MTSARLPNPRHLSPLVRRLTSDRVVIATHNPGKLAEMRELLAPYGIAAISAGELALAEPEETGMTFAENARIKATDAATAARLPALAPESAHDTTTLRWSARTPSGLNSSATPLMQ